MTHSNWLRRALSITALVSTATAGAQARSPQAVARNLVKAGLVQPGDKVLVSGSLRDASLLEDIAIETLKAGAFPLISIWNDRLTRRAYDEVPAAFDNVTSPVDMLVVNNFDVQISLDVSESDGVLAGVPTARRVARDKAAQPVNQAYYKRNVRVVNLGNGLYPTSNLSRRLNIPQTALGVAFWKAAAVNPATLRTRGEALRQTFANGKSVTLTSPNGTNLTFRVDADRGIVSDGALTAEKVKRGAASAATYLPAGELILPADNGSANGTVVFDRSLWDGRVVQSLTLTFKDGVLMAMTAANDISGLKARYDAAGGSKDRFGFIDIGINPESRFPVGSGHIVWTAPGSVIVGFGDNRGFGGENASDFALLGQLGDATVTIDGQPVVSRGRLK
jgi:leucyl aminopeptidase (aminopeptidase T)